MVRSTALETDEADGKDETDRSSPLTASLLDALTNRWDLLGELRL